jgi:hypothetical protein
MNKLIEYINTLDLTISQELFDRHDEEYATTKSGYSSRANLDSEYLEDMVCENVKGAEAITTKPDRFLADVKYKGMVIDFKEIASRYHNLQHDYLRYIEAQAAGQLTHFLYFKSNRERYASNMPDVIQVGYKLQFEFLGIYDVNTVMSQISTGGKHGKIDVYNLGDNYGRRIDI